jgi:hypothetical protein
MQQSKSAEKQNNVRGDETLYEDRRLDAVKKNFAFGLQKEFKAPSPDGNAFCLNNQPNRN